MVVGWLVGYIETNFLFCLIFCCLRSSSHNLVQQPRFNLQTVMVAVLSLLLAAPALWNTLPLNVKNSPPVAIFKQRAKTFPFKEAFY